MAWAKAGMAEDEFCVEFLHHSPVTPAALRTLEEQGFRWKPENLRKWLITRAREMGKQLDNAAAQERKVAFFASEAKQKDEYDKLIDLQTDADSPEKDGAVCIVCDGDFKPMSLFFVRDGQRVISKITNEPVRIGNYKLAKVNEAGEIDPEKGMLTIVPCCKYCSKDVGGESYTYANAKSALEEAKAEKEADQDRAKKGMLLRKSLVRPDGSPRFDSGDASDDMDKAASYAASRRNKGNIRGTRRHQ